MRYIFPFPNAELAFWLFDSVYYVEWNVKDLNSLYTESTNLGSALYQLANLGLSNWEIVCINKVGKRTGQWQELWLSAYDKLMTVKFINKIPITYIGKDHSRR